MKWRIVSWFLGLVGICTFVGCQSERCFHCPSSVKTANGGSYVISGANRPAYQGATGTAKQPNESERITPREIKALPAVNPVRKDKPAPQQQQPSPQLPPIRERGTPPATLPPITQAQHEGDLQDRLIVLPSDTSNPLRSQDSGELNDAVRRALAEAAPGEKIFRVEGSQFRIGQADNYKQLTGQLQRWRKSWRLRYASVDTEDPYGGSILLEGIDNPGKLRDGQYIRVTGTLVPPRDRRDSAHYIVQSLHELD